MYTRFSPPISLPFLLPFLLAFSRAFSPALSVRPTRLTWISRQFATQRGSTA